MFIVALEKPFVGGGVLDAPPLRHRISCRYQANAYDSPSGNPEIVPISGGPSGTPAPTLRCQQYDKLKFESHCIGSGTIAG